MPLPCALSRCSRSSKLRGVLGSSGGVHVSVITDVHVAHSALIEDVMQGRCGTQQTVHHRMYPGLDVSAWRSEAR